VKRVLLFLLLLFSILLPTSASAWPTFVVFTYYADPLDPLGGTSTGWFRTPGDVPIRYDFTANRYIPDMDFWWQAQHWTRENAMLGFFGINNWLGQIGGWRLDGGLENIGGDILFGGAAVGNDLDHLFDFRMATSDNWDKEPYGGHFVLGETYTTIMNYVNPTTSHHAANGSYYIATGTFYLTDEQPAPSSAPGIPEPSSLALVVLGLGAVAATRRSTR